jgi:2-oxoglutarate ferredoxin oxidoreductase subunit alpha
MQEITVRAGGQAGDGIASVGETFSRSFSRMGLHVFGMNAYQSIIRGGLVWFQARASPDRVYSQGDSCDILYALDKQTVEVHGPNLSKGGTIVYDPEKFEVTPEMVPAGAKALAVPTLQIARKYTTQSILQNAAGMGAIAFLAGVPLATLQQVLSDSFGKKKGDVVDWNLGAAADGYNFAKEHTTPNEHAVKVHGPPKLLINGNQAIGLGAAAAGCKILAQYPMTPATSIMHWMATHSRDLGIVVKQAEDELAAINMAIGSSFAGVRAMTASSGGGICLMVEAMGMAGMTETPVVVVDSMRAGPSTGLPTKTEQADLNLFLGAGQSEFPRAIFAPSNVVEAYHMAIEAFRVAEDWQTPVVLASDLHLSESFQTFERSEVSFDVPVPSLYKVQDNDPDYKRYKYTPNGVSLRSFPGQPGLQYVAGSDEHDEKGYLLSDTRAGIPVWVEERKKMMAKRMGKLAGIAGATQPPLVEGAPHPEVTFVCWGSAAGAVRDAIRILGERGIPANMVFMRTVYPVHEAALKKALSTAKRPILVELNYSGQLGHLIRAETGIHFSDKLLKYDGEPLYPREIVNKALEVIGNVQH